MGKDKKLAIVTCCLDDWGGSEELWAKSIAILDNQNLKRITIYKNKINQQHPEFVKLKHKNIFFKELIPEFSFLKKGLFKLIDDFNRLGNKIGISTYNWNKPAGRLYHLLKSDQPDLVLISQGINFDGLVYAWQCLKLNIPYIIVSHKAVNFYWPQHSDRSYMKETLIKAEKCLFVSEHNRKLTEEQFGIRLPNSAIVMNPVKTRGPVIPYPLVSDHYRLACIGRLFVIDKGQDILLRVLAQPKWKVRKLSISFIGKGPDKDGLKEMATLLGVENISFEGYNTDLKDIWANHHALILPSRSEGLPLTIIEAMFLGRIVITTNAGGNTELVEDQETGFIAEANEKDLDEAMERAWQKRDSWQSMGAKAALHIAGHIPEFPEKQFANLLNSTLNEQ
ncbi:glycosyltransferase involved in cell wall biosynthesis [Pedobacter cryoconitis]|uniref:glycosyltransferase family 4 protein n=1 Tax=Pedobacter cryoconitis TaxID=188932 RepID=UPI0016201501|nr:glycosyltransferase family 4 protein [Pedobacter cryoconitis]MBB6269805.1 glycosyltransferase involved in cell wall biosynthesis [Pedobacter cryoconitis]